MFKNLVIFIVGMFVSVSLFSQELTADDRVTITQSTKPFIGVFAFGYQGLPTPGYPQFQLNNYGGIPGTPLATTDNSILGMFAFSGHNGSAKKTVGIIRVKSMNDFATSLSSRMDFLLGPNREQRMTILGDSGNVGIGTETPSRSLEVHRSGSNAAIEVSTDNSNAGNAQIFLRTNETSNDEVHLRKWGSAAGGTVTASSIPVANLTALRTGTDAGSLMLGTLNKNPLYLVSNDKIGFYMDTMQSVGLGTIDPTERLDVDGNIRMRAGAVAGYIPTSDSYGVMYWTDPQTLMTNSSQIVDSDGNTKIQVEESTNDNNIRFDIGGTEAMILNNSRRLGLGTSNPLSQFHIASTSSETARFESSSNSNYISFYKGSTRKGIVVNYYDDMILRSDLANSNILFQTEGNNERMRINATGVGIGTATPTTALDVNGQIRMQSGATTGYVPVSDANGVMTWTDPSIITPSLWEESAGDIYRSTGKVGIGTQAPDASMHVVEDAGTHSAIIYGESTYVGNEYQIGVRGKCINNPGAGDGGRFEGGYRGVFAVANSTTSEGLTYGVQGTATGTAGVRIGVSGTGVTGGGIAAYGVCGEATGSDVNYSIYGKAGISGGVRWAGYFDGNTHVTDTLTIDDRVHINADGVVSTERLVVVESANAFAAKIENNGTSFINVASGNGLKVVAGFRGIDVDMNLTGKNGNHHGYYMNSFLGSQVELSGSQYGMYSYTSGARAAGEGNYSIYATQGSTAGSGTNWAGYFSGNIRVTGTIDNTSDAKLKKDIEDLDDALGIIKQLQAKTYEFRTDEYPHMVLDERPQLGFIAQDMEKVLPQLVRTAVHPEFVNDEGEETDMPNSPAVDVKSINYIGIIPVLTQGIKELTTTVEEKEEIIENLVRDNVDLKTELANIKNQMSQMANLMNEKINQIEKGMSSCCFDNADTETKTTHTNIELNGSDLATLEQNAPNPFNEQTIIKYYIPSSAQKASMTITDIKGSPLKSVNLEKTGLGTVRIHANELTAGTYIYTLYVDGKQIASKQMILIK